MQVARTAKRLTQFFHPVARSEEIGASPRCVALLNEDIVVFRARTGEPLLFKDVCIHRGTRLSLGDVTAEGQLRCPYHG